MRRFGPPLARQHMLACVREVFAGVPLITRQAHPQDAAERAPSPSALIPVLSTARQSPLAAMRGDEAVQWPRGTAIRQAHVQCFLAPLGRLLCNRLPGSGRHKVLKSDATQSRPTSCNRLWIKPVVWRSGIPNGTFSPSQDIASQCLAGQWSGKPEWRDH
jgi:hypothetical protein